MYKQERQEKYNPDRKIIYIYNKDEQKNVCNTGKKQRMHNINKNKRQTQKKRQLKFIRTYKANKKKRICEPYIYRRFTITSFPPRSQENKYTPEGHLIVCVYRLTVLKVLCVL